MTNEQKLLALGAECVGGDLILRHKVLGRFRNGDLYLTDDGKQLIEQDVEGAVEEVKPKRARAKTEPAAATHDVFKDLLGE